MRHSFLPENFVVSFRLVKFPCVVFAYSFFFFLHRSLEKLGVSELWNISLAAVHNMASLCQRSRVCFAVSIMLLVQYEWTDHIDWNITLASSSAFFCTLQFQLHLRAWRERAWVPTIPCSMFFCGLIILTLVPLPPLFPSKFLTCSQASR